MNSKISFFILLNLGLCGNAFGAVAPDFTTFYDLYKTATAQNDITITSDITATRLLSVPGAQSTIIDGAGFDFNGAGRDGFTVSNGYNFSLSNAGTFTVSDNVATVTKSYHNFNRTQGGLLANLGGNVAIDNSAFTNNVSLYGGGVLYQNNGGIITVTNSVFDSNKISRGDGAVLYNEYETVAVFDNVIFQNNAALNGYGGIAFNDGTLNISNSTFASNESSGGGAALYNSNTMNLTNVRFTNNNSTETSGAIYTTGAMRLDTGTFENNSGDTGGAIGNYGIIGDTMYSIISNSTFSNNTATYGGAIYNWDDAYIVDSDFQNNSATDNGGAIFNLAELYLIANEKNMTFSGNTASGVSNAIHSTDVLNMNAASGLAITFNDAITGTGQMIINRPYIYDAQNVPTGGTIVLNTDITDFAGDLTVYGGTFDIGISNVTVDNAEFLENSTLQLSVQDAQTYGNLSAGNFDISPNANLSVVLLPNAMDGVDSIRVQLLRSENEFIDEFVPRINNSIYEFLQLGDGWYEISASGDSFADIISKNGGSQNNIRTAAAWQIESGAASQLGHAVYLHMNALLQTDVPEYIRALSALAPSSAPLIQTLATSYITHMASFIDDNATGQSKIWASGMANGGHISGGDYADFDMYGGAAAIGAQYAKENWTVGATYMYQYNNVHNWARTLHVPTHGVGVYAVYAPSPFIARAATNMFYSNLGETKNVSGIGVTNDSRAYTYGAWGDIGWNFAGVNWHTVPRVGIRYLSVNVNESTDAVGQMIQVKDSDFVTLYTNVSVARDNWMVGSFQLMPEIKIGASYDIRTSASDAIVSVNDTQYEITSYNLSRVALDSEFKLNAMFTPHTKVNLAVGAQLRDNYVNYAVRIGGTWRF